FFRMHLRFGLIDVAELAIDAIAILVATERRVVLQARHPLGHNPLARNRSRIVATLGSERCASFLRSGKRVEALDRPVVEHLAEDGARLLTVDILDEVLV